jgi:hypothetical protein
MIGNTRSETDAPAFGRERTMAKLSVGDPSPEATLDDIDGATVKFPAVFAKTSSTVIFVYRGRW